jgi:hypothetical protein
MSTVTMQELELETAELLPARETLNHCGCHSQGGGGSFALVNVSGNNIADGNLNNINVLGWAAQSNNQSFNS